MLRRSAAHLLPCDIQYDGSAPVSRYFKPNGDEAAFRGRHLCGMKLPLPAGYSGAVLQVSTLTQSTASSIARHDLRPSQAFVPLPLSQSLSVSFARVCRTRSRLRLQMAKSGVGCTAAPLTHSRIGSTTRSRQKTKLCSRSSVGRMSRPCCMPTTARWMCCCDRVGTVHSAVRAEYDISWGRIVAPRVSDVHSISACITQNYAPLRERSDPDRPAGTSPSASPQPQAAAPPRTQSDPFFAARRDAAGVGLSPTIRQ